MTLHRITRITALGLTLCAGTAIATADETADAREDAASSSPAPASGSTTRDLNSGAILQRLVISTPDGGRMVRWVPRPAPRVRAFNRGGYRVSIPSDSWGLPPADGGLPGRDLVGGAADLDTEMNDRLIMPERQGSRLLPGTLRPGVGLQPTRPNKPRPDDVVAAGAVLQPGDGFAGEAQPARRVGSPSEEGYTAQAIARWNVVPYQHVTDDFRLGVVAFHRDGIDRVEFSLDGGPWIVVDEMELNERTKTWEYSVTLDPGLIDEDGLVEIRARVIPTVGEERLLAGPTLGDRARGEGEHSMFLAINDGGTLARPERWVDARRGSDLNGDGSRENPFNSVSAAMASIQSEGDRNDPNCNGAIIYCEPGHYLWGPRSNPGARTSDRWMTIKPAEGVSREQVVFDESASGGFRTELIKLENVTVEGDVELRSSTPAGGFRMLWLENVVMNGPGRTESMAAVYGPGWNAIYVIDSEIRSYKDAVKFGSIVRNTHAYDLGSDAFGMTGMVVNSSVHGINGSGTTFHPDVYQIQRGLGGDEHIENLITFNFKAFDLRAQGIFSKGVDLVEDVAFVNVLLERDVPESIDRGGMSCQWMADDTNHLLMWNVSLPGYGFSWRTANLANLSVEGCVFDRMIVREQYAHGVRPEWFRNNHYIDVETFGTVALGTNATIGDAGFVNALQNDYRPSRRSILSGRQDAPLVPIDAINELRNSDSAVGALSAAE